MREVTKGRNTWSLTTSHIEDTAEDGTCISWLANTANTNITTKNTWDTRDTFRVTLLLQARDFHVLVPRTCETSLPFFLKQYHNFKCNRTYQF